MTRYFVTIGERVVEIEIGADEVRVEGKPVSADLHRIRQSGIHSLLLDGDSHHLAAHRTGKGSWKLHLDGKAHAARVLDERGMKLEALSTAAAGTRGPRPVVAPMPGMVMKVEVAVGDEVREGQGIAIIEAMKMENELRADGPGTVSAIRVETGQPVEKGAILVEFE